MEGQPVDYVEAGDALQGVLYRPESRGKRHALMVVHGGAGLDAHARTQAERWRQAGYLVLACDLLGPAVQGDRERTVTTLIRLRNDPAALVRRLVTGLDLLMAESDAGDATSVVGYCFGGLAALALARSGYILNAAVSIHGTLKTSAPAQPGAVSTRVMVCHGAADPHVPLSDVTGFAEEMEQAAVRWRLNIYGGAMHGFTHRDDTTGSAGMAYNEDADLESFADAERFISHA